MRPKTMIPTAGEEALNLEPDKHARATAMALISKQVMHAMGKPTNLLTVQVRPLWEDWYRVNVFVGKDITSASIANSYFLRADGDGNVVESTPPITKRY